MAITCPLNLPPGSVPSNITSAIMNIKWWQHVTNLEILEVYFYRDYALQQQPPLAFFGNVSEMNIQAITVCQVSTWQTWLRMHVQALKGLCKRRCSSLWDRFQALAPNCTRPAIVGCDLHSGKQHCKEHLRA